MKQVFAVVLTLAMSASIAYAHGGMIHVMGTVSAKTDSSITVTTKDGKTQNVVLTGETKFARMDTAITLKDVRLGDHVVIHATKKGNQLIAVEVKVGAAKMKSMSALPMSGHTTLQLEERIVA